jgi:enoyl-CoA hydratase/carnithine racemase
MFIRQRQEDLLFEFFRLLKLLQDELMKEARSLANAMAANSPLVLAGIKETMNYGTVLVFAFFYNTVFVAFQARDHSVEDSLKQVFVLTV